MININRNIFFNNSTYESFLEWKHIYVHFSYYYFIDSLIYMFPFEPIVTIVFLKYFFYSGGIILLFIIFNRLFPNFGVYLTFLYILNPIIYLKLFSEARIRFLIFLLPVWFYFLIKNKYRKMFAVSLLIIFLREEQALFLLLFYVIWDFKKLFKHICLTAALQIIIYLSIKNEFQFFGFFKGLDIDLMFSTLSNHYVSVVNLILLSGLAAFYVPKFFVYAFLTTCLFLNVTNRQVFYEHMHYITLLTVFYFLCLIYSLHKKIVKRGGYIIVLILLISIFSGVWNNIVVIKEFGKFLTAKDFNQVRNARKFIKENIPSDSSVMSSLTFQEYLAPRDTIRLIHIKKIDEDFLAMNLNDLLFIFSKYEDKEKLADIFFAKCVSLLRNKKYFVYYFEPPILILSKQNLRPEFYTNCEIENYLKNKIRNNFVFFIYDNLYSVSEKKLKFYFYSKSAGEAVLTTPDSCQHTINYSDLEFYEDLEYDSPLTPGQLNFLIRENDKIIYSNSEFLNADNSPPAYYIKYNKLFYKDSNNVNISINTFNPINKNVWWSDYFYTDLGDVSRGLYMLLYKNKTNGYVKLNSNIKRIFLQDTALNTAIINFNE
ncbi:MAG TPA: hypothetical protein PKY81_02400 [bacterium]|nr:hypothetical protein [bacterium]HPN29786.1 hypothetical protein [bacterium]